jgi:hypothetical protein
VRYLVSHPYKTVGKIVVLYILLSVVLGSRVEDKRPMVKCYSELYCFVTGSSSQNKRWDFPISQMGGFKLDRHQGFEKVSTEESDDEGTSNTVDYRQQPLQFA